jgi:anti-anti-sigma factor
MSASIHDHRLHIDAHDTATAVVLGLRGELDAGTAPQLERSLAELRVPGPLLVLDLHALSFVDSLGLNMLFRTGEWAQARGVTLRVVRAPVHVQRLIALAAMDGTFGPYYADVEAALRP